MQEESDPAYSYRGPSGALKVIRGRGCEESFRAAVVDPNHRSEIGKYSYFYSLSNINYLYSRRCQKALAFRWSNRKRTRN